MTDLIARFDVTGFEPSTIPGIDDDWVGAIVMRKTFLAGEHQVNGSARQAGRGAL